MSKQTITKEWDGRYTKYINNIFSIFMNYLSHGDKDLRDKQLEEVNNSWYRIELKWEKK